MSLYSAVALVVSNSASLVDDGAVTFSLPGLTFTNSSGDITTAVLASTFSTGFTSVRIKDVNGSTLVGDVMEGSTVTIDGNSYTVADVRKLGATIGLDISPGLLSDAAAGTLVTSDPVSVSIDVSTTVSTKAAKGRTFEDQVAFAFQYPRSSYSVLPRKGWRCTRTSTAGTTYTGNVVEVDTGEIMVIVWCGGKKS